MLAATTEPASMTSTASIAAEDPVHSSPSVVKSNGGASSAEPHSFLEKQNEGVLRDVLDELDRERSQRAEMEARMRKMEQEVQNQKRINAAAVQNNRSGATAPIQTSREFLTLQAERDGYLDIVNALTQDRPAFSKKQQRLPIHVVRLLEVIPWDPRARQHLFGQETLYEWQILGADKTWQTKLRYFPTVFKTLPIVVPQPGKTVGEAPTSSSPPKQCVLTNLPVTQILNIDKGYPLPQDGGDWVWVGGWRIENHSDSDADGWSYSNDFDLTLDSSYYSEFRPPQRGTKNLVKRRRKWTRSRVMIDYPQASAMTKEYLKMVAEKSSLDVSVQKLSTQLVETKMKLTTLEAEHLTLKEDTSRKIAKLEKEAEDKNRVLEILQTQDGVDAASISNLVSKKEQVKELRSVVTAWVSNTVSKRQVAGSGGSGDTVATDASDGQSQGPQDDEENAAAAKAIEAATTTSKTSNDVKQLMFESLKGKGTDLFEKIKQKGGEEFEKIKKQKGRPTGLSSWKNNKKSEEETLSPTDDTKEEEKDDPSPKVELI
jgi:hypothetical protein